MEEKLHLISMVGRQQDVIAYFSWEKKYLHESLSEVECKVATLGSDLSSFKESMALSGTKKEKAKIRLDSKLTVCKLLPCVHSVHYLNM